MKYLNALIGCVATCTFFFQASSAMAECPALSIDIISEVFKENDHTKDISIEGTNYQATVGLYEGQTLDNVGQAVIKNKDPIQNECDYTLYSIGISRLTPTGWASLKMK